MRLADVILYVEIGNVRINILFPLFYGNGRVFDPAEMRRVKPIIDKMFHKDSEGQDDERTIFTSF